MMKRSAMVLWGMIAVLACTGCGFYQWNKPGATEEDFKNDAAACEQQGSSGSNEFDKCMAGKGWTFEG